MFRLTQYYFTYSCCTSWGFFISSMLQIQIIVVAFELCGQTPGLSANAYSVICLEFDTMLHFIVTERQCRESEGGFDFAPCKHRYEKRGQCPPKWKKQPCGKCSLKLHLISLILSELILVAFLHMVLVRTNVSILNWFMDFQQSSQIHSETVKSLMRKIFQNYISWCEYLHLKSNIK